MKNTALFLYTPPPSALMTQVHKQQSGPQKEPLHNLYYLSSLPFLQREKQQCYKEASCPDDKVHRDADTGKVSKTITTRTIYNHVGRRTDRSSEAR